MRTACSPTSWTTRSRAPATWRPPPELPDAGLAAALEEAATAADALGAPSVAAELAEHALRLTDGTAPRRTTTGARSPRRAPQLAAGAVERARALAQELVARAAAGRGASGGAPLMAAGGGGGASAVDPVAPKALGEGPRCRLARVDPPAAQPDRPLHRRACRCRGARASPVESRKRWRTTGPGCGPRRARAHSLQRGRAGALELAEQAHELAAAERCTEPAVESSFALAHILVWSVHLERARALLEGLYVEWSESDERMAAYALWYLSLVELRAGRYALAGECAERARSLSVQYARDEVEAPTVFLPMALVAAHRGDLELAREYAERACRACRAPRIADQRTGRDAGNGSSFWSGDPEAGVARFAAAESMSNTPDGFEPGMCWWRAEQIEALLELGLVEDAVERLDAWEADARRLGRDWVLAHAARCRGLVAAARGEIEQALLVLGEAISLHEAAGDPFGRARALLALGAVRRRARQKRPAREAIEAACAGFEQLEAVRWTERAREELGRIGGRTRIEGLTPAERRVADLVAKGRTNAEVAAALFLAERTVASHLTRVYSKLGVRSRTELFRRFVSRRPDLGGEARVFADLQREEPANQTVHRLRRAGSGRIQKGDEVSSMCPYAGTVRRSP